MTSAFLTELHEAQFIFLHIDPDPRAFQVPERVDGCTGRDGSHLPQNFLRRTTPDTGAVMTMSRKRSWDAARAARVCRSWATVAS